MTSSAHSEAEPIQPALRDGTKYSLSRMNLQLRLVHSRLKKKIAAARSCHNGPDSEHRPDVQQICKTCMDVALHRVGTLSSRQDFSPPQDSCER